VSQSVGDLGALLRQLAPSLNPGVWVFISAPVADAHAGVVPLARFREAEGESWLVEEAEAVRLGAAYALRCAWISLGVHSDLAAVGLTAAVSGALAAAGISCNVIAALRHDHLLVPHDRAGEALRVLEALMAPEAGAV
jgi:hypothetical protein